MRFISTLSAILFFIFFFSISLSHAAAEQRTALVIGNGAYSSSPLKNPTNDASDMAAALTKLGFSVTLKKDANHQEMEDAIREFGDKLKKGGVGLFFYAGHGTQIGGRNYLLPVGARINKETDVKFQSVDAEMVLSEMGNAGNNLNIVILDACRDNPFGRSFRSASRGLAIISDAPKGTIITYSTSPGKVAADGSGRNSPYAESLIHNMMRPGVPIEEVFKTVRRDIGKKTDGQQVPWELSSLDGQFFFRPSNVTQTTSIVSTVDYAAEQRKINEEKERLRKEQELLEQQESLAEERRKLEERKKHVATIKQPSSFMTKEINRDGRFIAYNDDTVLDTKTNLMWADTDSGRALTWAEAKSYCDNYRGGGYADWRMPTISELNGLYDKSLKGYLPTDGIYSNVKLPNQIRLSGVWVWSSEIRDSMASYFDFCNGWHLKYAPSFSHSNPTRALPVRSHK